MLAKIRVSTVNDIRKLLEKEGISTEENVKKREAWWRITEDANT